MSNTMIGGNILEYNFDNERPIYIQLVEQLEIQIISGKLKQGERLPSVRDFSLQAKVNPNTMQKALSELEREKLIYTERTNGKYVTNNEKIINKFKMKIINEKMNDFITDMNEIGISKKEVIKYMKELERNENK
jgi:DNA-binding transcriptional regulator YhcF (GntR family)